MNQSESSGESDRPVSARVSSREVSTEVGGNRIPPAYEVFGRAAGACPTFKSAALAGWAAVDARIATLVAALATCIESLECAANDLGEVQLDAGEREKQAEYLADTAFAARKAIAVACADPYFTAPAQPAPPLDSPPTEDARFRQTQGFFDNRFKDSESRTRENRFGKDS